MAQLISVSIIWPACIVFVGWTVINVAQCHKLNIPEEIRMKIEMKVTMFDLLRTSVSWFLSWRMRAAFILPYKSFDF